MSIAKDERRKRGERRKRRRLIVRRDNCAQELGPDTHAHGRQRQKPDPGGGPGGYGGEEDGSFGGRQGASEETTLACRERDGGVKLPRSAKEGRDLKRPSLGQGNGLSIATHPLLIRRLYRRDRASFVVLAKT